MNYPKNTEWLKSFSAFWFLGGATLCEYHSFHLITDSVKALSLILESPKSLVAEILTSRGEGGSEWRGEWVKGVSQEESGL